MKVTHPLKKIKIKHLRQTPSVCKNHPRYSSDFYQGMVCRTDMYNRSRGSGGRKNEIMEEAWQGPLGLGVGVRREAFGGYKAGTGLQGEAGEKGEGEKGATRSDEERSGRGEWAKKRRKEREGGRKVVGKKKRGKKRKSARGGGFKDGREVKNFRDGAWRGQERRDEACVARKRGKRRREGGRRAERPS
jgi:hypothetical protein